MWMSKLGQVFSKELAAQTDSANLICGEVTISVGASEGVNARPRQVWTGSVLTSTAQLCCCTSILGCSTSGYSNPESPRSTACSPCLVAPWQLCQCTSIMTLQYLLLLHSCTYPPLVLLCSTLAIPGLSLSQAEMVSW